MINDIPMLWFWISGVFFLLGIVMFGATIVVLYKLLKLSEDLKPRVEALTVRVEALMTKIDGVTDRLDNTIDAVRQNADGVGSKANSIMGAVEHVATRTALKLDSITPILAGAMAAYRIFQTYQAHRTQSKPANPTAEKALPKGKPHKSKQ